MPRPIYLYRCFDADGQLLYVGLTDNVGRRKREHAGDKFWWQDVARVNAAAFETRLEAQWAEWAVITTCAPVYNRLIAPPAFGGPALPASLPPASPTSSQKGHSRAAIANAKALRDRYGKDLPTVDRQIRTDMGWSHDRLKPALAAYHAGADLTDQEAVA